MNIIYINNDGSGYAGPLEISAGTTVSELFQQQLAGKPEDYLIRVNRQCVPADHVLQEQDRVSFTPTKIEGASSSTCSFLDHRTDTSGAFHDPRPDQNDSPCRRAPRRLSAASRLRIYARITHSNLAALHRFGQ